MATTAPTITLPAADTPLTAVGQPDPIGSVQPLPTYRDGRINGTVSGGLAAKVLLGATTPLVAAVSVIIPSTIPSITPP
jgi:hypothetical protein